MSTSFLHGFFHSDSSHRHNIDTHFSGVGLDAPPPTPEITQPHTPYSRPSSPSQVLRTSTVSPEQFTTSSAVPTDELLSDPEVPRRRSSFAELDSKTGKSKQTLRLSTTKPGDDSPTSTRNDHQPLTRLFNPAVVLENSGSVARDHLASERTFLAYVRTSLGIASAGVALVQLFSVSGLTSEVPPTTANLKVHKFATPLGLTALAMALIVLLIGVFRYFLIQNALPENRFPTARLSIAFISFGLGAITVVTFGALLNGKVHD